MIPTLRPRDPRQLAPVGAYMTDGRALLWILESEATYVLGEDVCSAMLVQLEPVDLMQHWRRVRPAA